MWTSMTQMRPDVFTESNDEGVERVKRGRGTYAFLMESTSIEYQTARDCDLMKIGGQLDTKGYGIAMPVGNWNKLIDIFSDIKSKCFIIDSKYFVY